MKKLFILSLIISISGYAQEYKNETINFDGSKLISDFGYDETRFNIPTITFSFMDRNNPSSEIFKKALKKYRAINFPSGYINSEYHPDFNLNASEFDLSINDDFYPWIDKNLMRVNGITWEQALEKIGNNQELIEMNLVNQRIAYVTDRFYRETTKQVVKNLFSNENGDWSLEKLFRIYVNSRSYEEAVDASLKVGDLEEVLSRNAENILEEMYIISFELFVIGDKSNESLPKGFYVEGSNIGGSMQDWANSYPPFLLKSNIGLTVGGVAYVSKILWDEKTTYDFFENWYNNPDFFEKNNGYPIWQLSKRAVLSATVPLSKFNSREEAITQATFDILDKFVAKIQKRNPRFRPLTRLVSNSPNQIKIGSRDGLTKSSKLNVYSLISENNVDKLKKIGSLKVSKLWNNEYDIKSIMDDNSTILKGKDFPVGSLLKLDK
jgi:hypothetical protein